MIRILREELAAAGQEAVLRPVSAEWTAVTPAMRRLELAAGPTVESQCQAMGELPVGSAIITGAGDLAARFMVHVVVRSVDEQVSAPGVQRGLQNGVRRLAEWGIRGVALPPLGTGAGNLDPDDAAAVMVPVLQRAVDEGALDAVDIHVESDYELDVFRRHAERSP
ncbi:MAG TPA: macro domain-containing protein [Longimicrobiales bacterium]|nr:macro domain-containing protein [Longimicrobiales bacterium]